MHGECGGHGGHKAENRPFVALTHLEAILRVPPHGSLKQRSDVTLVSDAAPRCRLNDTGKRADEAFVVQHCCELINHVRVSPDKGGGGVRVRHDPAKQ